MTETGKQERPSRIKLVLEAIEKCESTFAVSRLIMSTGVDWRGYEFESQEDRTVLAKLRDALPKIVSEKNLPAVVAILDSTPGAVTAVRRRPSTRW